MTLVAATGCVGEGNDEPIVEDAQSSLPGLVEETSSHPEAASIVIQAVDYILQSHDRPVAIRPETGPHAEEYDLLDSEMSEYIRDVFPSAPPDLGQELIALSSGPPADLPGLDGLPSSAVLPDGVDVLFENGRETLDEYLDAEFGPDWYILQFGTLPAISDDGRDVLLFYWLYDTVVVAGRAEAVLQLRKIGNGWDVIKDDTFWYVN